MKVNITWGSVEIKADTVGEGYWSEDRKILEQLAKALKDEECVIERNKATQTVKSIKFFNP